MDGHTSLLFQAIAKAKQEITYPYDGPVTPFVALMRTLHAVQAGKDPDVYGNAYAEWLEETHGVSMNDQKDGPIFNTADA